MLDANAVRCSHEQVGAAAGRTKSPKTKARHGVMLRCLKVQSVLYYCREQASSVCQEMTAVMKYHLVGEKWSRRPRCAAAAAHSSKKGLLSVVPVGTDTAPVQHLMRWNYRRFVMIVLPGRRHQMDSRVLQHSPSLCVLANAFEYRWNTGKLM